MQFSLSLTQLNSAQLSSTQLYSAQLSSIQLLSSTQLDSAGLKTKKMHLFGTTLKVFAEILKKLNSHGIRSYANVYVWLHHVFHLTIYPILMIFWPTGNWTMAMNCHITKDIWCYKVMWTNFSLSWKWFCIQIFVTMKRIMSNRIFFCPWPNMPVIKSIIRVRAK